MKSIKIIFLSLLLPVIIISKPYQVPIGSKDNTIQLTVKNKSNEKISQINVKPKNIPDFIDINQIDNIEGIEAKSTGKVSYSFQIDEEARVDSIVDLKFDIQGKNTEQKVKEISLQTAAPKEFKLKQNYPNPFNPTTNIAYNLPQKSKVTINIFNIKGQKVETLVQNSQKAGIYQKRWNASRYSSGIYFYRIRIKNAQGIKTKTRKMTVLK